MSLEKVNVLFCHLKGMVFSSNQNKSFMLQSFEDKEKEIMDIFNQTIKIQSKKIQAQKIRIGKQNNTIKELHQQIDNLKNIKSPVYISDSDDDEVAHFSGKNTVKRKILEDELNTGKKTKIDIEEELFSSDDDKLLNSVRLEEEYETFLESIKESD